MKSNKDLEKIIARIGDLPAIPKVVAQVMALTEKPGVPVSEVSAVIEQDMGLTAKLLKVSNSSYYGMRQVIGTLKLALVILGIKEVRNIVVGISVMDQLNDDTTSFLLEREGLWDHSALVASYSKKLGVHLELSLQGEDFIAGLLHDIGKLVLWKQMHDEYEDVYTAAVEQDVPLYELEHEVFGFDHADVASALAVNWGLPDSLTHALEAHHPRTDRVLSEMDNPALCAIVRIANLAAREEFSIENTDPENSSACTEEESWGILAEESPALSVQERYELLSKFESEMKGAQHLAF